jgi:hypothetical protein
MTKGRMVLCFIFLLSGLPPLLNSLSNNRFASLRGSDRLQLIAVGLCFGAGFGVLIGGSKPLDK